MVLGSMSNHLDHLLGSLYGFPETIYETNRLTSEVRYLEGDIVECGIACGAQLAAMKLAAPEKLAWGYDSFEGIELAGKEDEFQPGIGRVDPNREIPENRLVSSGITSHSLESVLENLNRWCLNPSGFRFVKGWVQRTMVDPRNLPDKICILRLDMDMHDATKTALECLFPRLVPGGVLIIDDWEYLGVHTALKNYFASIGYTPDWKHPLHAGYLYK